MKLTEEQKKISTSQKFWDNMEKGKQQIKHWQQQPLSQVKQVPVPAFQKNTREELRKSTVDITESADGITEKYCYVMHKVMKVGFLLFYIQPSIKDIWQKRKRSLKWIVLSRQNLYGKTVKEMSILYILHIQVHVSS